MTSNQIARMFQIVSWARAKGELMAVCHTFYSLSEKEYQENLKIVKAIEKFIKYIDDKIAD